jgi:hypothetical protein
VSGRGWFRYDRDLIDAYCRDRGLRDEGRALFVMLLLAAFDTTGTIRGDLAAIADDLAMSRFVLGRRLPALEAAGVVIVERSHAPGRGAVVIVDYAFLNPQSRLAQRGESCRTTAPGESSGS